eukprot:jgi/Botrbrau1/1534/Bobra.0107s0022.1
MTNQDLIGEYSPLLMAILSKTGNVGNAGILQDFEKVKGVGVGHSWWQQQFCAGTNDTAIQIVTTEIAEVLDMNIQPSAEFGDFAQYPVANPPTNYPVKINEDKMTVTVQSGVILRVLLDYLAIYKSTKSPTGYTLPAFSWYIDQTVGGAVATATHGSTLKWGSLSSQVWITPILSSSCSW